MAGARRRGRRVGNGSRLMHDECLYYANKLQQPLSYVPRNELRLVLMAEFLHTVMGNPMQLCHCSKPTPLIKLFNRKVAFCL